MIQLNEATINNENYLATSNRYNLIKTADVIDLFQSQGFKLADYQEANYRKKIKENKVRHLIRMSIDSDAELRRDVVIFNSHDSSTSLRINFGMFRFVCSNGMVVGDDLLPELRIKHTKQNPFDLITDYANNVKSTLHKEEDIRDAMKSKQLSYYDIAQLAEQALPLRKESIADILDPLEVTLAKRKEDQGKSLWHVFNRIQENLIHGNYEKLGLHTDDNGKQHVVYKKAKILTSPNELIRVNKSLHNLAMSFL